MKTKKLLLLSFLAISATTFAQTPVNKTIPVQAGQSIEMHFDYPELIRVSTWDKNEISITGSASINDGENDNAFVLNSSSSGQIISISNEIANMKNLPHRITIVDGGQKIVFKDKEALNKYKKEHGKGNFDMTSYGLDMEIILEIKVPKTAVTRVESVYGMVEVKDYSGPLTVESTYGGVDAALTEKNAGEVIAETNYGEIYTNFDTKFGGDGSLSEDFHTVVAARPGTGPKYAFESKYGNVYLRKAQP